MIKSQSNFEEFKEQFKVSAAEAAELFEIFNDVAIQGKATSRILDCRSIYNFFQEVCWDVESSLRDKNRKRSVEISGDSYSEMSEELEES